jgi:hypothetical protein
VPQEPKPAPPEERRTIQELAWSKTKVPVGEAVEATFTVEHFEAGDEVILRVYERDADGGHDQVDTVNTKLEAGSGPVRISWTRGEDRVQEDLEEDRSIGDPTPLEYVFDVTVQGVPSTAMSDELRLTNTVIVDVADDLGLPVEEGTRVDLTDGEKTLTGSTDAEGLVRFEGVLVGAITLEVEGGDDDGAAGP